MNAFNLYGIYNNFNKFLEEEDKQPTKYQQAQQAIAKVGDKIENIKDKYFKKDKQETQQEQIKVPRSNNLFSKIEREPIKTQIFNPKEENLKSSNNKSPTTSQSKKRGTGRIFSQSKGSSPEKIRNLQTEFEQVMNLTKQIEPPKKISNHEIFKKIPRNSEKEKERQINQPKQSQGDFEIEEDNDRMLDSKIDKSAFLNEDDVIEKMYYQENNEGGILSTLISRLGKKPSLDKLGSMMETLIKKERYLKNQIGLQGKKNENLFGQGVSKQIQLHKDVCQCYNKVKQSRRSLKIIKEKQIQKGIIILQKIKELREKQTKLQYIQQFENKFSQLFQLIREASKENKYICSTNLSVKQIEELKQRVQSYDKKLVSTFYCFNDLKPYLEGLISNLYNQAFTYFTQNLIQSFIIYKNQPKLLEYTLEVMTEYLHQQELLSKGFDFANFIKNSIQSQMNSITRKKKREGKLTLIESLQYQCLSFYDTAYSIYQVIRMYQQLQDKYRQNAQRYNLYKKYTYQYQIQINSLWLYLQEKTRKKLKKEKNNPQSIQNLIQLTLIIENMIKIGETISKINSDIIIDGFVSYFQTRIQLLSLNDNSENSMIKPIQSKLLSQTAMIIAQKRVQMFNNDPALVYTYNNEFIINSINGELQSISYEQSLSNQICSYLVIAELSSYFGLDIFFQMMSQFEYICYCQIPKSFIRVLQQEIVTCPAVLDQLCKFQTFFCELVPYLQLRQMVLRQHEIAQSTKQNNIDGVDVQMILKKIKERLVQVIILWDTADQQVASQYLQREETIAEQLKYYLMREKASQDLKRNISVLRDISANKGWEQKSIKEFMAVVKQEMKDTLHIYGLVLVKELAYIGHQLIRQRQQSQVVNEIEQLIQFILKFCEMKQYPAFISQFVQLININQQRQVIEFIEKNPGFPMDITKEYLSTVPSLLEMKKIQQLCNDYIMSNLY